MKKRIIIIIILTIVYFLIVGVLGFIVCEMLMERYPLIGLFLGIIAAACMSYWFKDNPIDAEPPPDSKFILIMFACLAIFWPLTLSLSIVLGASYLFAHIIRLLLPVSRVEGTKETYRTTAAKSKGPLDFINEIKEAMKDEHE